MPSRVSLYRNERSLFTFAGFPTRVPQYSFYWSLLQYTLSNGWVVPGHGNLNMCLEEYVMARDGRYHRCDHMGYLQVC